MRRVRLLGDQTEASKWVGYAQNRAMLLRNAYGDGPHKDVTKPLPTVLVEIWLGSPLDIIQITAEGGDFVGAFIGLPASDDFNTTLDHMNGWGKPFFEGDGTPINPPLGTPGGERPETIFVRKPAKWKGERYPDYSDFYPETIEVGNTDWVGPNGEVLTWWSYPSRTVSFFPRISHYQVFFDNGYDQDLTVGQIVMAGSLDYIAGVKRVTEVYPDRSVATTNLFTGKIYRDGKEFASVYPYVVLGAALCERTENINGVKTKRWYLHAVVATLSDLYGSQVEYFWAAPLDDLENPTITEILNHADTISILTSRGIRRPSLNTGPWFFNQSGTEARTVAKAEFVYYTTTWLGSVYKWHPKHCTLTINEETGAHDFDMIDVRLDWPTVQKKEFWNPPSMWPSSITITPGKVPVAVDFAGDKPVYMWASIDNFAYSYVVTEAGELAHGVATITERVTYTIDGSQPLVMSTLVSEYDCTYSITGLALDPDSYAAGQNTLQKADSFLLFADLRVGVAVLGVESDTDTLLTVDNCYTYTVNPYHSKLKIKTYVKGAEVQALVDTLTEEFYYSIVGNPSSTDSCGTTMLTPVGAVQYWYYAPSQDITEHYLGEDYMFPAPAMGGATERKGVDAHFIFSMAQSSYYASIIDAEPSSNMMYALDNDGTCKTSNVLYSTGKSGTKKFNVVKVAALTGKPAPRLYPLARFSERVRKKRP